LSAAAAFSPAADSRAIPRPEAPRPRIVSFSPALTRIIFDMGLGDHVVGVTRLCRLPEDVERVRLGDAYTINAELILSAAPDLILAQTSPDKFRGVVDVDPAVRVVQIKLETLADISAAVEQIGMLTGRGEQAEKARAEFLAALEAVRARVAGRPRPRVIFVIGTDRPIAAGAGNFVADLIETAGGVNAGADIPGRTRWRRTTAEAIVDAAPDILICQNLEKAGSEQVGAYWLKWQDLPAARNRRVYVVDAADWSIPSTRLAELADRLAQVIQPAPAATGPASRSKPASVRLPAGFQRPAARSIKGISLWEARLARLVAAAIVGAALAAAGAALQGLLRNPLAEPYILGISSGAGVGVLLGFAIAAWYALPRWASTPVLAFVGAMITCAVVYLVAQRRGRLDPYSLILAGVIINTFNAAILLTINLYVDPDRIPHFAYWAMGSLEDSPDRAMLWVCGGCALAGWAALLALGAAFNLLGLGDDVASSSGVRVHLVRLATFACVGVMTASAVALAGPIGFLGLIVPHICRMILGPEHRRLIVVSGVVGAGFMIAAEWLCRSIGPTFNVSIIPVGIITAAAGGPFFIFLLRRRFMEARA
jgi:iron complex transport system permease protein